MNSTPQWQLHHMPGDQGLAEHRRDWDRLNQHLMGGHAMLDGAFVEGLLRHFGADGARLAVASQGGEPVAMLLLNAQSRGMGVWSGFLPSQSQISLSLIPAGLDLSGLFRALPGYTGELDLLCNDPRFVDLRELPGHPVKSLPHALTMNVSLRGSFDDYWAQRPRKLVQNMRRYMRRLQSEAGAERLDIVSDATAMPEAVARYAELESSGWKGREGTAISRDNAQGRFYAEVMCQFAARGEALVYELWLGDDLVASRMLLLRDGMAVMLKTAFHEEFDRFAPGRILLLRTLEDLFTRLPGGVVEFYTNAEADLLAWSTSQRWINHISVYRHRGLPHAYELMRLSKRGWRPRDKRPMDAEGMASRSGASVDVVANVRELPTDALALMSRREQGYVEFGADWFGLLADTVFQGESQATFYVLRRQGRVLAVLPVGVQPDATGRREPGALANYYTTLYSPLLEDELTPEDLLPLVLALRRAHRAPAYRFWPMDPQSREFKLLRDALRLSGLRPHEYFAFGNWFLPVQGNWTEYLKERSGQLRSTIKRMTKRLATEPDARLEIVRDEADVERGIAAYQAVYGASWKVPEPYPDFIPGLIRLCARRGWLRLGLAWIGDKPIAAQLWIVSNGRANIYKLAYDEAFKSMAPGTVLTALLMEEAIERDKVTEIDYLIGDDAYKKTWMSHRRERFGLVAYDPTTPRGLAGLLRQALGNASRRLRRPTLPADNPAS
ncbi:GNAT family N-acetyltransferase [Roseateles asaccharophilus]|uniref:CelD/BcsL family acetyltransferase involved in cellulose biosynthesis n=1 Tax=Roseateles asaccharophilus TaxID=582607 RepID=A0ABU2AAD1_9BURK|nr:GNAT family N-acetyltransferase [Roseateles asaccharophilus]MDR7334163.1 CelD/BcsL family acetyltransferase involved in cellulose biosynthesis [Roseateles asaccharophilus]